MAAEAVDALGWKLACDTPDYTVLLGTFEDQQVLVALVSASEETVRCALPLSARELLETPEGQSLEEAFPSWGVQLARVRDRGVAGSLKCRVVFVQLPLEIITTFFEPNGDEEGVLPFTSRSRHQFPHHAEMARLIQQVNPGGEDQSGGAVQEDLTPAGVVCPPALADNQGRTLESLVQDLTSQVSTSMQELRDRIVALEGRPTSAGPGAGTPFTTGGPPGLERGAAAAVARQLVTGDVARPVPVAEATPNPPADPALVLASALQKLMGKTTPTGYEPALTSAGTLEELESIGLGADGLGKLGAAQLERLRLTRESHPELIIQSQERELMRELGVLPNEGWSYMRHAREKVLPNASGHHGLRKTVMILAHALDLHRVKGPEHSRAFLAQAYKASQAAAYHPNKQWSWGWPLLGLDDPDGVSRPGFTASEFAALSAYHRDQEALNRHLQLGSNSDAGRGSAASSTRPGDAVPGSDDSKALRAELEKLKKQLADEKKKTPKGGGRGRGGKGGDAPLEK
eukprot:6004039-Amphidinium_carterae.2